MPTLAPESRSFAKAAPGNILVHEVNWLGDLVMTLPALHALRRAYPLAHLSVLIDHRLAAFFDGSEWINDVIPLQRTGKWIDMIGIARLAAQLRRRRFDLAVVLPNSFVSAMRVALARIPTRVGFARDRRGLMLTRRATLPRGLLDRHQVYYWLALLKETLGVDGDAGQVAPDIDPGNLARMRDWLAARRDHNPKLIAIAPGAAYGPAKEWPRSYYAELVQALEGRGAQCVLVGSGAERAACAAIAANGARGAIVAAGQTNAGELIALLAQCGGFVGNDSGAAHLASALGIATVAIFGSTSPHRTGPLGPRTGILYQGLECSPCLARTCRFGHYNCLREIKPAQVIAALQQLRALP